MAGGDESRRTKWVGADPGAPLLERHFPAHLKRT